MLARAGVTKGGLYFHFPSKRALAEGGCWGAVCGVCAGAAGE
ncbi:TetR/AcrR family transcriptional regulator [Streptomyces sp. S1D4-14]|nr:TetR/AcrR family transcriptional regulator [Streptomyces sp. S1D4-14]